ncbi:type II/IV secretion system ATPase subunit [Candidatus Parvarchaeota archaeon]|nr:type II/IV secretion system ATPase subunit [Candidatus Parvarchaeota archaeon]
MADKTKKPEKRAGDEKGAQESELEQSGKKMLEEQKNAMKNSRMALGAQAQWGLVDQYFFNSESIPVNVRVSRSKGSMVPFYELTIPGLGEGTKIVLNTLKGELVTTIKIEITDIIDPKKSDDVKLKFEEKATSLLSKHFPTLSQETKKVLASYLIQNTLGLGELESLMHDEKIEEVAINSAQEPVWIFHKKWGWCQTNIKIKTEEAIYDYSAMIGRKIGKQINVLSPLMDAHLSTGDRVNATLFPASAFGNTITIRKFSKNPWTITTLVELNCLPSKTAALIWLCIQNELSLIVSGGTGSGKTSFLNAISGLIPGNQRVVSLEDTRELTLPSFLQWVPMVTREPNAEGKGEITMLDLLVNSLRQRPDRIVVGEIRRQREAEILFEAMHTGHSVYATLHADNAAETVSRLTNPPINIPKGMLDSLAGIVVQFRHRRLNVRRTLEFAEVQKGGDVNVLQRWDLKTDRMLDVGKMFTLANTLSLYAGFSTREIEQEISEKASVIDWMVAHKYREVNQVGNVVSRYYVQPEEVLEAVRANREWKMEE